MRLQAGVGLSHSFCLFYDQWKHREKFNDLRREIGSYGSSSNQVKEIHSWRVGDQFDEVLQHALNFTFKFTQGFFLNVKLASSGWCQKQGKCRCGQHLN